MARVTKLFDEFSPFALEHPTSFVIENKLFTSVYQFVIYQKTVLYDQELSLRVLKETDIERLRLLDRRIRNVDQKDWANKRKHAAFLGTFAKVCNDFSLYKELLTSANFFFGFASPHLFWGTGKTISENGAKDLTLWNGDNHLGQIIGHVSTFLKSQDTSLDGLQKGRNKKRHHHKVQS